MCNGSHIHYLICARQRTPSHRSYLAKDQRPTDRHQPADPSCSMLFSVLDVAQCLTLLHCEPHIRHLPLTQNAAINSTNNRQASKTHTHIQIKKHRQTERQTTRRQANDAHTHTHRDNSTTNKNQQQNKQQATSNSQQTTNKSNT